MANPKTTPIVDYLKSVGKPSSFGDRTTLAKQYGITDYTGTAAHAEVDVTWGANFLTIDPNCPLSAMQIQAIYFYT